MELIGYTENNLPIFVKENPIDLERVYYVRYNDEPISYMEVKGRGETFVHRTATWDEKEQHRKIERLKHIKTQEHKKKDFGEHIATLIFEALVKTLLYKTR